MLRHAGISSVSLNRVTDGSPKRFFIFLYPVCSKRTESYVINRVIKEIHRTSNSFDCLKAENTN